VARIEQRLASVPGVFLTGSGFRAIGIPDCISDAREVAANAAAYVTNQVAAIPLARRSGT
jgi:oxygen-dependent protoporphyrinogen oxidase